MPKTNDTPSDNRPQGLYVPNSFQCPNEVVDELLSELSGSELKVLLYIVRRTFGFQKESDNISLSQMLTGIVKHDGTRMDRGAGIKDKKTLLAALRSLEEKRLIFTERRRSAEKGNEPTAYHLNLINFSAQGKIPLPLEEKSPQGGGEKIPPSPRGENPPIQNPVLQNPVKQNIDPSNIRNAKSNEFDYVNSNGSAEEASEGARLTQNDGVEHSQHHGSTQNQNVEKIENEKNIPLAAPRAAAQPSSRGERNRKGGLTHIGQALQDRLPVAPPAPDDAVARDAIERYIRDTAAKLHDEAPLKSSVTRAWNDYKRSGVDLNRFFNELYDAEKEANRRSATIKKLNALGFKNRMAYFFAILEDKLGLREKALPNGPQSP